MENLKGLVDDTTKKIEEMGNILDEKVSWMLVQFDTLVELHKEERLEMQKAFDAEKVQIREHHERVVKQYKQIAMWLSGAVAVSAIVLGVIVYALAFGL